MLCPPKGPQIKSAPAGGRKAMTMMIMTMMMMMIMMMILTLNRVCTRGPKNCNDDEDNDDQDDEDKNDDDDNDDNDGYVFLLTIIYGDKRWFEASVPLFQGMEKVGLVTVKLVFSLSIYHIED